MSINKKNLINALLEIGGSIILGIGLWILLTLFGVVK